MRKEFPVIQRAGSMAVSRSSAIFSTCPAAVENSSARLLSIRFSKAARISS